MGCVHLSLSDKFDAWPSVYVAPTASPSGKDYHNENCTFHAMGPLNLVKQIKLRYDHCYWKCDSERLFLNVLFISFLFL